MPGIHVDVMRLRKVLGRIAPTLRDAAVVVGVSEDSLSNWLSGRTRPRPATVARILDAAHAELNDLTGETTEPGLAELRRQVGLSRTAAARAAGISRARWGELETGQRTPFSRDIPRIAAALSLSEDAVRAALRPVPVVMLSLPMERAETDRFDRVAVPGEDTADVVLRAARLGLQHLHGGAHTLG